MGFPVFVSPRCYYSWAYPASSSHSHATWTTYMIIWNHRRKWTVARRFCLFPFDRCRFLRKIWLSNAAIKAYPPAAWSVWRRLLCRSWGFWSVCARLSFYRAFSAWSTLCHLTCKKHRLAFWAHWRHIDFFPRRRRSDSHPNHLGHLFYPYS